MRLGLSPRVRGNHLRVVRQKSEPGSIPACAGEPCATRTPTSQTSVYPRVCGGTVRELVQDIGGEGLSPRVRGNHPVDPARCLRTRSIPACAGEPGRLRVNHFFLSVYPRVCGGTGLGGAVDVARSGLSPRVRGNPNVTLFWLMGLLSIPACAGEPSACLPLSRPLAVYPRVCGGTHTLADSGLGASGLSPRVRGNPIRVRGSPSYSRSIPACAGEPPSYPNIVDVYAVYPRVCGGTCIALVGNADHPGLSPRVRGNLVSRRLSASFQRSIPACAGEPIHVNVRRDIHGVYPRVCGGTRAIKDYERLFRGLSPRVRGNLRLV